MMSTFKRGKDVAWIKITLHIEGQGPREVYLEMKIRRF